MKEWQRTRYRALIIGHIWQQSGRNLLPDLSVTENINLPQTFNGTRASVYKKRTKLLLELVGLSHLAKKKPAQLSGGEQQRIALAVALANEPSMLLADEPTGSLDSLTAQEIIASLRRINQELGMTVVIVTHDVAVAEKMDRTIAIRDGRTSTVTVRRKEVAASGTNGSHRAGEESNQPESVTDLSVQAEASSIIGLSSVTHEETVLIDRIGLVQLPAEFVERFDLRGGRVDIVSTNDHVEIWPGDIGINSATASAGGGQSAIIGLSLQEHQESVLVDRVGRLQLPSEVLANLNFNGQATVRIKRARLELWPPATSSVGDVAATSSQEVIPAGSNQVEVAITSTSGEVAAFTQKEEG
jgi:ABC-type lipoprotein export system ATPase subunit/DNA-binding transcriptional regulator/RsmH inhibitor MraZ